MSRAFLVVMDSVGCGGAPDAADFGDEGANTLAHIAEFFAKTGRPLALPNLTRLGLWQAVELSSGVDTGLAQDFAGAWGVATEHSPGKDTPTGHWELSGVPVPWNWHYFPDTDPSFPQDLSDEVTQRAGGILGNCHASGTEIIDRLGAEHIKTGWPICYTSADSVFQIAAHEDHFGLERLLQLCRDLAPRLHGMKVGRVIARPFVGSPGSFERTDNRKDFAVPLPSPGLCDWAFDAGREVLGIGKIKDIFSGSGISKSVKGSDLDLMEHFGVAISDRSDGSLTFANFVEFDSKFGHRRDPEGYGKHLEWFDAAIGRLLPRFHAGDILVLTADHGNDPTWVGTDHTRERVPVLVHGLGPRSLGHLDFVDVAASIAKHLELPTPPHGESFL